MVDDDINCREERLKIDAMLLAPKFSELSLPMLIGCSFDEM